MPALISRSYDISLPGATTQLGVPSVGASPSVRSTGVPLTLVFRRADPLNVIEIKSSGPDVTNADTLWSSRI